MNKKGHAISRKSRLKHPHAPVSPAGTLAAETAGPAEDVEKMAVIIEELRVAEEELRVQNEELALARQTVEAERARYYELFDCAPDGYLVTDAAGIIREANRTASVMLNVPRQGLLGKPFALYVAAVDRDTFRTHLSQIQSEKASKEWEFLLKPRGRPPLSVALNVSIAEPSSESGLHIRWLLRDITQRKQAEEALQKVWENYHNIFEHAVEGIFQESPEGRYLSANPSLARIYGYESPEDLMGSVTDIAQQLYVDPARREELKRLLEEQGVLEGFEAQIRRKDGATVWVSEHVRAVRDRSGKVLYYEGTIQDITERKRVEDALRDSEALLQAIIDNSPSLIFLKDTEGRYLLVNQQFEKLFHRTREDIVGKTDEELFQPAEASAFRANDRQVLQAGAPLEFEEVALHDGGPHTSIVFKFPLRTADGKAFALGGIATDITERKKADALLQESLTLSRALSRRLESVREEERARIARDLHDEVGQALTALKLNVQVAQRKSPDELRLPLERSVGIIDRLIDQVRSISLELRPSLLDDLGLVTTLKWWTEHQAPQTGARIELTADPIEPRLPLELETACFRIVEEAVNNATKYAQAQRINVILSKQDGTVDLLIRDDGVGFDVNAVWARAARGESMGLSGMEERVKHLGGRFTITSQPGQGTEVRATFPLALSAGSGEKAELSASR